MDLRKSKFKIFLIAVAMHSSIFFIREANAATQDPPFYTTFNVPEINIVQGWIGDQWSYWGGNGCNGPFVHAFSNSQQITNNANNPLGSGNGYRGWLYQYHGLASACATGNIVTSFTHQQPELWIRWYARYQSGLDATNLYYNKLLYIRTGPTDATSGATQVIPGFYGPGRLLIGAQGTGSVQNHAVTQVGALEKIFPGGISDGQWHCIEIHIKMDTTATGKDQLADGIAQLWIDGINYIDVSDENFSAGDPLSKLGWGWFDFPNNYSYGTKIAATYVNSSSFSTAGNTTWQFIAGHYVAAVCASGRVDGTIVSSSYDSATGQTIVIISGGSLDSGLTDVYASAAGYDTNGQEMYMDWDDMSVANDTSQLTNVDAAGHPMIGPLDWPNSNNTTPPNAPLGLLVS